MTRSSSLSTVNPLFFVFAFFKDESSSAFTKLIVFLLFVSIVYVLDIIGGGKTILQLSI